MADIASGQEKTGTIQGVVRFTGEVPPAKKLPTGDGGFIDHHDLIVDAKTKGLRWVIAALEDAPAQPKVEGDRDPVLIDQMNTLFVPRVVAVQHGQPVQFDNSDAVQPQRQHLLDFERKRSECLRDEEGAADEDV